MTKKEQIQTLLDQANLALLDNQVSTETLKRQKIKHGLTF